MKIYFGGKRIIIIFLGAMESLSKFFIDNPKYDLILLYSAREISRALRRYVARLKGTASERQLTVLALQGMNP